MQPKLLLKRSFYFFVFLAVAWVVNACASNKPETAITTLQQEVRNAEQRFANTMANRDFAEFQTFIASDAIFFSGDDALKGRQRIAYAWRAFFANPQAPFSWRPDIVEVLSSGELALSSGPVYDPAGKQIGRFNSIWRRTTRRTWEVVFDRGSDVCGCAEKQ